MTKLNRPLNVLVACEESQAVTKAFRLLGHNAFSCDIKECSGGHPEWHFRGDALALIYDYPPYNWDILIAHPPCTYLSKAGASLLFRNHQLNEWRYREGLKAAQFFMKFYNAPVPCVAVENPVPMKVFNLPPYSQIIQPHMFSEPYQKATCLWLRSLPPLIPDELYTSGEPTTTARWFQSGTGAFRQTNRSKTFPCIARAMAEQWSAACYRKLNNDFVGRAVLIEQ